MAIEIVMPRLGWTMEEGTLVEWSKQSGENVAVGDIIMLVESDKAVNEVEAFDAGVLHLPADAPTPGATIQVGTVMGYILDPGERAPVTPLAPTLTTEPPPTAPALPRAPDVPAPPMAHSGRPGPIPGKKTGRKNASPRARRVAVELGVDLASVVGSGSTGRIIERDVHEAAHSAPSRRPATTACVTVTADASSFTRLHDNLSASRTLPADAVPSTTDLLIKLCAVALMQQDDDMGIGGREVIFSCTVVDKSGPTRVAITDAAGKSLRLISAERRAPSEQQPGRESEGSIFAIVDAGPSGVDSFQPTLENVQIVALGVGTVVAKADGSRPLTLNLVFDSQHVSDVDACAYLSTVRDYIQDPYEWLAW